MTPSQGPLSILAISGSLRTRSSNTILLEAAARLAAPGLEIGLFNGIGAMPHFNPDLDGPDPPPAVAAFRARLAVADGLLISSPEYAHGVPGVLKNALDWLVSGIEAVAMPVMLLNASPRATHAQASLIETLRTMAMEVVDGRPFDVPIAGRPLDLGGVLADPELVAAIQTALGALLAACARSREAGRRLVP